MRILRTWVSGSGHEPEGLGGGTIAHRPRIPRPRPQARAAANSGRPAAARPPSGPGGRHPPAVTDIVRTAVLGCYGVAGFADDRWAPPRCSATRPPPAGDPGRALDGSCLGRPATSGRLRPAGRRGRPPGRVGGPLRAAAGARPRARRADHPRRRAALRAVVGAARARRTGRAAPTPPIRPRHRPREPAPAGPDREPPREASAG